jgi:hypothetical protein
MQRNDTSHYSRRDKQGYNNVSITKPEGSCSATMQTLWSRMVIPWSESIPCQVYVLRNNCDGWELKG